VGMVCCTFQRYPQVGSAPSAGCTSTPPGRFCFPTQAWSRPATFRSCHSSAALAALVEPSSPDRRRGRTHLPLQIQALVPLLQGEVAFRRAMCDLGSSHSPLCLLGCNFRTHRARPPCCPTTRTSSPCVLRPRPAPPRPVWKRIPRQSPARATAGCSEGLCSFSSTKQSTEEIENPSPTMSERGGR